MEGQNDIFAMLELMLRPSFCVRENRIEKVNAAAEGLYLPIGTDVRNLLITGQEDYESFSEGCLYLELDIHDHIWGASITRMGNWNVFALDCVEQTPELQVLALASQELRTCLSSAMIAAEHLQPDGSDPDAAARLNRALMRTLRLIGNMSDAAAPPSSIHREIRDVGSIVQEIYRKTADAAEHTGVSVHFECLSDELFCPVDSEILERAILNLLSNAFKFTPRGGSIYISLSRRGSMVLLQITDTGCGLSESSRFSVFSRYLRTPTIEDSRHGMGLGLVIVRTAASAHNGTVLLDQPEGMGLRVTMTLSTRCDSPNMLHSPILFPDYSGGWDHCRMELSDVLPLKPFRTL